MKATRKTVLEYVQTQYSTQGERLWERYPEYVVLRHPCGKWYGVIMDLPREKLGMEKDGRTDVLVVKCAPQERDFLLCQKGFYPAYHMNKSHWVTVVLEMSDFDTVCRALDNSYALAPTKNKKRRTDPSQFLVPCKPQILFDGADCANLELKGSFIAGDRLYLYIPCRGIAYACDVVSVSESGGVSQVKASLAREYSPCVPLDVAKEHGICSVNGARKVPYGLYFALENKY